MAETRPAFPPITIALPPWVPELVRPERCYPDDESRMRLAVDLSAANVEHGTGGPFGSAVFEAATGRLVGVGVNMVVPARNAVLHAEIVAFMIAQQQVGSYTLAGVAHELFTSCEPCAMCLGATLWSGVQRAVWAATRDDANRIAFDEGPVFPSSYEYLRERGIALSSGPLRAEARAILERYGSGGGAIYNA
jgi:tRNA(Arg) A34 adenosine deaminase TadA